MTEKPETKTTEEPPLFPDKGKKKANKATKAPVLESPKVTKAHKRTESPATKTPKTTKSPPVTKQPKVTATPKSDKSSSSKTEPASAKAASYVVRSGDTLSQIVWRQYHTLDCIKMVKKANNIKDGDKIKEGQLLILPAYKK